MRAQAQANAESSERAAMAELQKQQSLAQTTLQVAQGKSEFDIARINREAEIKQQLMELQFNYDKQLKEMELQRLGTKESLIEDRKDTRTRIEGTQQSQMIDQRKNDLLPTDFEKNQDSTPGGMLE